MAESAGAVAAANDATVAVTENPPDPERVLKRLHADVAQCRRVLAELEDGQERQEVKFAEIERIYTAKLGETDDMVFEARCALDAAKAALAAGTEGN